MQSRNSYQSSSRRTSSEDRSPYAQRRPYSSQGGGQGRYSPGAGRPQSRGGSGARAKQFIHPSRYVQAATVTEKTEYVPVHSFTDFEVHRKILDNIVIKGFEKPSAIQDQTIPLVLQGRDVVGIANTGTGKTAAFAIPMIHDLITHMDHRAIIMAPTRELAQQIMDECFSFGKGCGLRSALLIGGSSMSLQRRDLRYNPRVVIGTPGRIKDHIQQGTLPLSLFNFVVLDEVDRMLDMGFINDISGILSRVSPQRQSLFFSATMEPKIARLIEQFSRDPVTVSTKEGQTVDSVSQDVVYYSGSNDKIDKLHDVLITGECKAIIFDDTKRAVERLGRELSARGFKVDEIHGDKSQAQRSRALKRLKENEINILVATDVAARGIDVSDITHVINYSTPNSYDDYVHRIGRTGRAGKAGIALTFLSR
ncbi:MAG: ATP-dependent helicase [Spirochaetae bacterium HGW-Spirochaetae-3]|nr:MAG: ATP-dependent helicase [Spirochaetae bacterium HGW-Spirochaetae-3]